MKKFIVFFLLCTCLFCASLFKTEFDFSRYSNLKVNIMTSSKCDQKFSDALYVDNGNGQIIVCDYSTYKDICKYEKNISGVTFVFDGDNNVLHQIANDLKVFFVEKNDSSFTGYTNYFCCSVKSNNKKVNVQGYSANGKIFIGTPLIMGSY